MESTLEKIETISDKSEFDTKIENKMESVTSENCSKMSNDQETHEEQILKDSSQNMLSKNQLKRQRKHERWLQIKAQKRKEEKIKKKKKFAEAREKGLLNEPTRKSLKKNCMKHSSCKIKVALDCSFDSYMTPKDTIHLVQQIQHSYSANRRAENPLQFYVCGVDGKTKQRLEDIGDYRGWDVYMEDRHYLDAFDKDSIVYLSSESPNVLKKLEEDKVYVIGGLVDHNHYKGLCHNLAEEKGVQHAQLPIGEYIEMKSRKVLTINHVFEILLKYTESGDWKSAFFQVLPPRKGISVRETRQEEHEETKTLPDQNTESQHLLSDLTENPPDCSEDDKTMSDSKSQKCKELSSDGVQNISLEEMKKDDEVSSTDIVKDSSENVLSDDCKEFRNNQNKQS